MMVEDGSQNGIIVLGPVGNRKDIRGLVLTSDQGYSASLRRRKVSKEELLIGDLSYDLFVKRFHRPQPWFLDLSSGVVVDTGITRKAIDKAVADNPGSTEFEVPVTMTIIRLVTLKNELISPILARNIKSAWETELGLKDFSEEGQRSYGRVRGVAAGYHQWSREEDYHGELEGEILITVQGGETRAQLDESRKELLEREWVKPFDTQRRTIVYAALQEPMTRDIYMVKANIADKEGAPTVAYLLRLIGKDEAYHGSWFGGVTELYAQLDREGTEQDVYFVARHFRFPADYYFLDPMRTFRSYRRGLGYSEQSFARRLYEHMTRFSFVNKDKAMLVAAEYGGMLGVGKTEVDEMLQWPEHKLSEAFQTDDRLKEAKYKTETIILAPRASSLVL